VGRLRHRTPSSVRISFCTALVSVSAWRGLVSAYAGAGRVGTGMWSELVVRFPRSTSFEVPAAAAIRCSMYS